jgi:ABC-type transport system substrate-binding protein
MDASYSAWSDEKIDALLLEIKATPDQDERAALYGELQVYMQENPPFIYLYQPVQFEAINTRVQEYAPLPFEGYDLFDVFLVGE